MHTVRRAGVNKYLALFLTLLMLLASFVQMKNASASTETSLTLPSSPAPIKNVALSKLITGSVSFSNPSVINDGVKNNTNAYSDDYPNGSLWKARIISSLTGRKELKTSTRS
jgi:hypothetical protein